MKENNMTPINMRKTSFNASDGKEYSFNDLKDFSENDALIDEDSQLKKSEMIKNFIISGLSSIFVYSDNSIAFLLLNSYLLTNSSANVGAANSYTMTFINILCNFLKTGFNYSMEIYTAQCLARHQFKTMNLYLRQGIFCCMVQFLFFGGLFYLAMPFIQHSMGLDSEIVRDTQEFILVLTPWIIVRIIGDGLKSFLRGNGIISQSGLVIMSLLALFCVYSYVIMGYMGLGIYGYGLCMLIYELSSLGCGLMFYFYEIDKRARNTSFNLFKNIKWMVIESWKSNFPLIFTQVMAQFTIFILTLVHSDDQLAALANLATIYTMILSINHGFDTYIVKEMNMSLGKRNFRTALSRFFLFTKIRTVSSIVLAILNCVCLLAFSYLFPENSPISYWIRKTAIPCSADVFATGLALWFIKAMISFEHKGKLFLISFIFGTLFRMTIAYLMIITFDLELPGNYWSTFISQISIFVNIVIIVNTDF